MSVLIPAVHSGRCGESNGEREVLQKGKTDAVCIVCPRRGQPYEGNRTFKFRGHSQCGICKQICVTVLLIYIYFVVR